MPRINLHEVLAETEGKTFKSMPVPFEFVIVALLKP